MIADPNEGPRTCAEVLHVVSVSGGKDSAATAILRMIADVPRPLCAQCEREGRCPTPQACEQAEQDRIDRAAWRDFRIAAVLIAVLAVVILVLTNWRAW